LKLSHPVGQYVLYTARFNTDSSTFCLPRVFMIFIFLTRNTFVSLRYKGIGISNGTALYSVWYALSVCTDKM